VCARTFGFLYNVKGIMEKLKKKTKVMLAIEIALYLLIAVSVAFLIIW
jgi:hypothetical protein